MAVRGATASSPVPPPLPKFGRLPSSVSTTVCCSGFRGLKKEPFLGGAQAMECSRGRRRWRWSARSMLKLAGLCLAIAICLCGVLSLACGGGRGCRARTVLLRSDFWRRTAASCVNQGQGCFTSVGGQWRRRLLTEGPGSYPPRCTAKCGGCSPCYPVHVAVPPGVPVTTEYYPEAWRCKCGNRLYMP